MTLPLKLPYQKTRKRKPPAKRIRRKKIKIRTRNTKRIKIKKIRKTAKTSRKRTSPAISPIMRRTMTAKASLWMRAV